MKNKKTLKTEDKIKNFSDLLESLSNTEDKKKLLWKESYQNALDDRENAHILLVDLMKVSMNNSTNHMQFGSLMSKYLERMAKSNDQILKLAELISKEQEAAEALTDDDIFNQIAD
jgi:3-methyladenine DNA glycosylase AlkC